jgi:hypothetical protein
MTHQSPTPLYSLFHFVHAVFQNRVRFPEDLVGQRITLDDGDWLVFREMLVDPPAGTPPAEAIFRPRFHVKGMSSKVNQWFSWLPIPFFAGLPGFRRKLWLVDPVSGDFSGYYEWQRPEDANAYAQSFAMRFMAGRSIPGSVSARVLENTGQL